MRCNECGYTNAENTRVCGKCQAPLSINAANNAQQSVGYQGSGKATVKGANANMPFWDDPKSGAQTTHNAPENGGKNHKNCPNCGYVLMPEATDCPNCDWQTPPKAAQFETKNEAPLPIVQKQAQGSHAAKSTMKLGAFNPMATENKFSLTDNNSQQKTVFEGSDIEVNRANLDANNSAISSKVHARFVFENGVWFIADESTNGATFVQVKGKIALEDGTVLIVGNKLMTFKGE